MKELTLDGAGWTSKDDVYSAFFHVVGAPEWHGRNFDELCEQQPALSLMFNVQCSMNS